MLGYSACRPKATAKRISGVELLELAIARWKILCEKERSEEEFKPFKSFKSFKPVKLGRHANITNLDRRGSA
jgi:hypothetical protein